MQLADRQRAFEDAVKAHFGVTKRSKLNQAFGVSNSAKVIEGGIQLGVPNLDKWPDDADCFVLLCVIRFPPEDEVYFAIQVRSGLGDMARRLAEMRRLGEEAKARAAGTEADDDTGEGALEYSARNNLVVAYLAQDGRLYFRNKGFWNSLRFDLSAVAPAVEVDSVAVAVYPPGASARRSMLAREFVGYLARFVGHARVHELSPWPDARALGPLMRRMPDTIDVAVLRSAIEAQGGHYVDGLVERFHEGLNFLAGKHFVILSGLSGTGKTQIAIKYARAVHGITDRGESDPLLFVCPVRPEWTDPTGLTGYHDVLSGKFVVPRFLEAVLVAVANRESPVFVVLDEMNLARVEFYLSEVLSAMESGLPLRLHANGLPLEGTTGGDVPAEVPFPPNLFLVGTVNMDETTNSVSDKVLDRAVVIDMSAVDLTGFVDGLAADPSLAASAAAMRDLLARLNALLLPNACGFGYRVAEEAIRYHAFASVRLGRASADVIDDMLSQKILVKLRGSHGQRQMLDGLEALLAPYRRSAAIVHRMAAELDELGSFRYAR